MEMPEVYRTDHVGSLVRPERLLDARDAFQAGKIGHEELKKMEDDCILEALEMQRGIGVAVLTDGEMRRDSYTTDQYEAVEGFVDEYPFVEQTKPDGSKVMVEMHTKAVAGKLRQLRRLAEHESTFLIEHAPAPFKVTLPTPIRSASPLQPTPPAPYTSWDEVQQDVVDIFRGEMVALKNEGVRYLQLDKVITAYANDESRERMRARGVDPAKALEAEIARENACYDAVRGEGMTLAMHLCRGNRMGWTGGVGSYEWPAERLFNDLHVDRFLLEFDTERAGGFEPLRFVPEGKVVMLGLVTTKSSRLEKQDDLLRRIDEASQFLPLEQLALGPQCGFQSAANRDGASMTIDDEKRKLELIVDTAGKVWG